MDKCALCDNPDSNAKASDYLRCTRKGYKGLSDGYYKPRLTIEELYKLPSGEIWICTNRGACQERQTRPRKNKEGE